MIERFIETLHDRARFKRALIHFVERRLTKKFKFDPYIASLKMRRDKRDALEISYLKTGRTLSRPLLPTNGYLCVIVGHTRARPGALAVPPLNMNEWEYGNELSNAILRMAEHRGHKCDIFLSDNIGIDAIHLNISVRKPDAIIELHFGSDDNTQVRGTALTYDAGNTLKGSKSKELAILLGRQISRALGRITDPVLDPFALLTRGSPMVILRPFYGSNSTDAKLGSEKKIQLAESIIRGFEEFLA